ncbi:MAG: 3'(2'),5'-bisphosphate nucleotidase CysQ [Egibacteraceae bacterium]
MSAADHEAAEDLATAAGQLLLQLREELTEENATELRKRGDAASHDALMEALAQRFPEDAVLSEEGKDDRARLDAVRCWIVDPLDGTREFGELGRSDWAVHVALVEQGEPVAGAVALPGLGRTLATASPPPVGPSAQRVRLVVSRTRPPEVTGMLASALDAELVPMGSAGAKAMAVLRGEADVYAHAGGQYEWDSAAPVAVAQAAGLHCSRLDGSTLEYNRNENPWLPDLLICRQELAERVLDVVGQAS